jgi:tetratricopeptide (TPR) repeat protein
LYLKSDTAEGSKSDDMKLRASAVSIVVLFSLLFSGPGRCEQGVMRLVVRNAQGKVVPGIRLTTVGAYSLSFQTAVGTGETRIVLPPLTKESQLVTLVLVPSFEKDYVLVSPWDGVTPVPSYEETSENVVHVVVARRSDKEALASGEVVLAMTRSAVKLMAANAVRDPAASRQAALEEVSKLYGLMPADVDHAIREWGPKATDKFQKALVLQYEGNYSESSPLFGEVVQVRKDELAAATAAQRLAQLRVVEAEMAEGDSLSSEGKVEDAAKSYAQAAKLQPNDPWILNLTGNLFARAQKFALAEQYGRAGYDLADRVLGHDHWLTIMCLHNLVGHLKEQGKYDDAFDLYLRLLGSEEAEIFSNTNSRYTPILSQMKRGQMDVEIQGLSFYGVVIFFRRYEEQRGPSDTPSGEPPSEKGPFLATVMGYAGDIKPFADLAERLAKYERAEPVLKHSLEIYEKALLVYRDDKELCRAIKRISDRGVAQFANFYARNGEFSDAAHYYKQAITSIETENGRDSPELIDPLNDFGLMLQAKNELSGAESLLARAFEILTKEKDPDFTQMVRVSNNLGRLFTEEHQYQKAELSAKFVLKTEQQEYGVDSPLLYQALINVADVCHIQDKNDEAESFLEQALRVIEDLPDSISEQKEILERLRKLYAVDGKAKEAERTLTKLIKISESAKTLDPSILVEEYHELAAIYRFEKQSEDGEKALKSALRVLKVSGKPEDLGILDELGLFFVDEKNYIDAENTFLHELENARANGEPGDVITALSSLSLCYYIQERYSDAEPRMKEWIEIMERTAPADKNIDLVRSRLAEVQARIRQ